jgi:iron complex transport system substrate-binding protein
VTVLAWLAGAAAVWAQGTSAPRRVASLNLTADEVLVEILPLDRLVAVTSFVDEPGTSNVLGRVPPGVVRFPKTDLERLVAVRPDLVVVSEYTDADFLKLLASSGLRYHRMERLGSLPGIRNAILALGDAVGEREAARRLAARFDARLDELAGRLGGVRRPRVLYWSNPFTAGDETTIGAIIEAAGGVNVGREMGVTGIQAIGAERAYLADPDYLLLGSWEKADSLKDHPLVSQMRAVREGRLAVIRSELLVAVSHHVAEACWRLAAILHPDRVGPAVKGTTP